MENASSVSTSLGDGNHGNLALVISPAMYQTTAGTTFLPPQNLGPVPVPTRQFMTNAEIDLLKETHQTESRQFEKYHNTDKALKQKLLKVVDEKYTKVLKQNIIAYTNYTTYDILLHLYHCCGAITLAMQDQATIKMSQPFNPALLIEDFFEQINDGQMLMEASNMPFTKNQLITKAFNLIFVTGVHNNACKEWRCRPAANNTWINFRMHFTDVHEELMELQEVAQQARYTSNMAESTNV
eukprot:350481-Ditylum_brightwellii.AAC.1